MRDNHTVSRREGPRRSKTTPRVFQVEGLEARQLLAGSSPDVAMISATTHDSQGVHVQYNVGPADLGAPVEFGVYRSADLATWEKVPGGALPVDDPKQWGNDWFWAPEVYFNAKTGLYFLFYAARSDANKVNWFGYENFEEPCKIGVAVSRSPAGPFHNIAARPIDYNPYDPNYHDVNLLMGPDQKKPPATRAEG